MIGEITVIQHKKDLMGNTSQNHLGDLNLLTLQEGSIAIFIGYQIKKEMSLNIIITSEAIHVNMVNHLPVTIRKSNKLTYTLIKDEDSNGRLLIGSHIGNSYNSDSIKEVLYNLSYSTRERYVLKIKNENNTVVMSIKNKGVELVFGKEPEFFSEEIFGIFKEKIYTFDLTKNVKQQIMISNEITKNNYKSPVKTITQEEEDEYYGRNNIQPEAVNVGGWIFLLILILIILAIAIGSGSDTPNQPINSQPIQQKYSPNQNYLPPTPPSSIPKDTIKTEQKKVIFQKQIIDGTIYNIINSKNGIFYMTQPYLDSTGYIVKVHFPNMNGYRIVAMTPTNCNVYNKRIKGESSLNPQLYLDGQLKYVFDSGNGINFIPIADYICNYEEKAE